MHESETTEGLRRPRGSVRENRRPSVFFVGNRFPERRAVISPVTDGSMRIRLRTQIGRTDCVRLITPTKRLEECFPAGNVRAQLAGRTVRAVRCLRGI